jgi:hypothetical protein
MDHESQKYFLPYDAYVMTGIHVIINWEKTNEIILG